jgi:hypothetical protein
LAAPQGARADSVGARVLAARAERAELAERAASSGPRLLTTQARRAESSGGRGRIVCDETSCYLDLSARAPKPAAAPKPVEEATLVSVPTAGLTAGAVQAAQPCQPIVRTSLLGAAFEAQAWVARWFTRRDEPQWQLHTSIKFDLLCLAR